MPFLPPPTPHRTSPGVANHTLVWSHGPSVPVQEALWFGWLRAEHPPVLSLLPEEGWRCSESSLVGDDDVWFPCLFSWFTILPVPSASLPPSLLNMYNNYTETATNLYIVFGSNSMRRRGTITNWGSCSPLLCKFKSWGGGKRDS